LKSVTASGAIGYDAAGRAFAVFELEVTDGVVQAIHAVVNPDKLRHIGPVSDVARLPEKELPQHRHKTDEGGRADAPPPSGRDSKLDALTTTLLGPIVRGFGLTSSMIKRSEPV
jgi:hypothetical protein